MEYVTNVHDRRWVDEDTPDAKGYEYIEIVPDGSEYTSAFSCELVRLGPFVEGNGEITIGKKTWPLSPGSYAAVEAGKKHSLRNLGDTEMLILTVYDPPRERD
jgi:glyoxylate utilization-related uncharacterized protein